MLKSAESVYDNETKKTRGSTSSQISSVIFTVSGLI